MCCVIYLENPFDTIMKTERILYFQLTVCVQSNYTTVIIFMMESKSVDLSLLMEEFNAWDKVNALLFKSWIIVKVRIVLM